MFGQVLNLFEVGFQGQSMVVFRIAGRVEERDGRLPRLRGKGPAGVRPLVEFLEVPALEFVPTCRVVPKPPAQRGRRSKFLEPAVEAASLLFHPPWPQPVHQETKPIFG